MTATDFDIAICGAGPVGQSLALLLHQQGMPAARIGLFDARTAAQAEQDARSIALSHGSWQILQAAGCLPAAATPIHEIHVSRRGHFGRSLLRASDYHVPALGYVARYGDIVAPMQQALAQAGITVLRPLRLNQITETAEHVELSLNRDSAAAPATFRAGLLIQAEGGNFSDQAQRSQRRDYQQTAIIAHIRCSTPLPGRAFERFTEQGPLALLPQDDGYALVWCVRPTTAAELMQKNSSDFLRTLQAAFGERLGDLLQVSERVCYPLGLNAQTHVSARTLSIGNAAQALHPVAGQGLNLGLRDSFILAQCLCRQPADTALASFIAARRQDRALTIGLTDTLARVFTVGGDGSIAQTLLGLGLGALDLSKPGKRLLAEQMIYGWR